MRKRKDGAPRSEVVRSKDPLPYVVYTEDMTVRDSVPFTLEGEDSEFWPRPGFLQNEEDYS